ncbi:MAG: efflux RND transporter permease subunit [candidate division Zixibacteria bacterium]|nr:efflux RND transporter permease subunit [candidate division Zixibacteria bacterium]
MILSDISIKRPVFATMMTLALMVLGVSSYLALSVDLFPDVDFPFVIVSVTYPGASAESVETDITKKVEDAVNTLGGIKHIESTALEGYTFSVIQFTLETDGLDAAAEVRDKIASIRGDLPEDIEEPVIQRYDPTSQPIISLAVSGPQPLRDLTDYVDDVIKPRLENISGVGAADIVGGAVREIQIRLHPERLRALDITPAMIAFKMQQSNIELPAGRMVDGDREWILRTMGRFQSVQQIRDMVVLTPHGRLVRLEEVADVIDTEEEAETASRLNGLPCVGVDIRRQSGANTVDVASGVKSEIVDIMTKLPAGMEIITVTDASIFIEESIHDVLINIVYGGTLAILVIFLFLANGRATFISGIAIPTSIIATFTLMRLLGFTINFMTLLGLSLAVGLLIDDAIVVIENIYRHMELGKKPYQAAKDATNEIGLAVSATTFSIMVVFIPVAFMSGIVGEFFYSFGMTIAFAILISLFIAFTLTPMMSSRFLKPQAEVMKSATYRILRGWNNFFKTLETKYYSPLLKLCLKYRFLTMSSVSLAFIGSILIAMFAIGAEFMPQTDQGVISISFEGRIGNRLAKTSEDIKQAEQIIMSHKEVIGVLSSIGAGSDPVNEGSISIRLLDLSERELGADSLVKMLRKELKVIPGYFFSVSKGEGGGGHEEQPIMYSVTGEDRGKINEYAEELMRKIRHIPGLVDLKSSEESGKPELKVNLNRDLISDLKVTVADVAMTLRTYIDGERVSRYKEGDDEYDIRLQVAEEYRHDIDYLGMLAVPSDKEIIGRDRFTVPLSQLADIETSSGPSEIKRYDRVREIRVSGGNDNRPTGDIRNDIQLVIDSMNLAPGYNIGAVGEAEFMEESFREIGIALLLAVIFIYLVLASLYDSFVDPLSIMVSQPLAIIGAMISLWFFQTPFSIMSLIGIILLMGLVTKNAILLIDFTKQKRAEGMERNAALLEAGPIRFRPIMMTALSTVLGVLPLALALGSGAELRAPIARAVIGGMISSTFLTLLVIPVVYTYFDDLAHGNFRAIFGMKPKEAMKKQPQVIMGK